MRLPTFRCMSFGLAIALAPNIVPAQATQPVFAPVQAAFFALSVPDLEASIKWYVEKLGLRVSSRMQHESIKGALLEGNGLEIELMCHPAATAPRDPMDMSAKILTLGITKAGIRIANFDEAIASLRARDVPIALGPFPARKEQRANAIIRDNSGNLIQLFGDFAR
jgi:catechol 2,3-dioxygenase-like lactoylglutathione lyase family enzyme